MSVRRMIGAAAFAIATLAAVPRADAAFTFTVVEQGSDVVFTGSGTLNLGGLSFFGTVTGNRGLGSSFLLSVSSPVDAYTGITGPATFKTVSNFVPTASSGDPVGIQPSFSALFVPVGYASGTPLSASMTFADHDYTTLGLTPGTFTWTWGSGAAADSFTIQITAPTDPEPVPEPASAVLFGAGPARPRGCGGAPPAASDQAVAVGAPHRQDVAVALEGDATDVE
ncbi:hypothetical protein [Elioraea rosea]|nr:hypothetical protein [Elioraea rosea]